MQYIQRIITAYALIIVFCAHGADNNLLQPPHSPSGGSSSRTTRTSSQSPRKSPLTIKIRPSHRGHTKSWSPEPDTAFQGALDEVDTIVLNTARTTDSARQTKPARYAATPRPPAENVAPKSPSKLACLFKRLCCRCSK